MGILEEIEKKETWEEFLRYKEASRHVTKKELSELRAFIDAEGYGPVIEGLRAEEPAFSLPEKRWINKKGTDRKRVVYLFPYAEKTVLRIICFLMERRYDGLFCGNCYAFRMKRSVRDAAHEIRRIPRLKNKYAVKIDIHDYFNSIPQERLVQKLARFLTDDPELLGFLVWLYGRRETLLEGSLILEEHGAMAGSPLSGFMANIYLTDLDRSFAKRGLPYFRYSDDIIVFTDTEGERAAVYEELLFRLSEEGLSVNPKKVLMTAPGEEWDYLGFSRRGDGYDLSEATIQKTRQKIRRTAHRLWRKRSEEGLSYEEAAGRLLRRFNKMFYDEDEENEFCWKRWYFTVVTETEGFRKVDACMREYLRYLWSGRHYKGNYRVSYEKLKGLGYRSLVAEYEKYKKERLRGGKSAPAFTKI